MNFHFRSERQKPIYWEGVRIDRLSTTRPTVLEPIDEESRKSLRLYRGINLGKIAFNLIQGNPVLNTKNSNQISFSTYANAQSAAESTIRATDDAQLSKRERDDIKEMLGKTSTLYVPAMVVALRPDFEIGRLVHIDQYEKVVPIAELEENSRAAIEDFFEKSIQPHALKV